MKEDKKICNKCGKEKNINEFNKNIASCKICIWKSKADFNNLINWSEKDIETVLDIVIFQKKEYLNDIVELLDTKSVDDICFLLKELKFRGGNYIIKLYKECKYCGEKFVINPNRVIQGKDKYCSTKCAQIANKKAIVIHCANCNRETLKTPSAIKKAKYNNFCSNKCADEFNSNLRKNRIYLICNNCDKKYEVQGHRKETSKFCSNQCKSEYQSKYLVGVNNSKFTSELIQCHWCGKEYYQKQYKLNLQDNHFCCATCRQEWFANVYTQTDEWSKSRSEIAVKALENGSFSTDTDIQATINNILNNEKINYINEKGFKSFAVDNYLLDYNLIIEVMGQYWHCDNRFYSIIKYDHQVDRIKRDKAKHTYFKNNENIEILYLWEDDIRNNVELVELLIKEYINKKGALDNYHSFNYQIKNNKIRLINNLIIPYMDWDIKELNKIIDLTVKEKMFQKQLDKWITFNCDFCGQEKEELISHYKQKKNHFCCRKCQGAFNSSKNRVKVNCKECNKELMVKKSMFKKQETFFCGRTCYKKYKNKRIIKCKCDNCGCDIKKNLYHYNQSENHFCSLSCSTIYSNKNRKC